MNINLIIIIVIYSLFFLGLIISALYGLGRGLKKSSLRLGTLIGFLIIAGIITPFISNALVGIDLSSFNIHINGALVTTIPEIIETYVTSTPQLAQVSSLPSVATFIQSLPIAILNIVVFMLLIFIMQFLSWILYVILSHTVLKETKLEKQIKKQRKLECKNQALIDKQLTLNQKAKSLPLVPPKKRRLLGFFVGAVQGFMLMFIILMPITSLLSSAGDIINRQNIVYAEENFFSEDMLSETSSDLIKNALGEEIIGYLNTFNSSVPTKILNFFGLNNAIFDSLTGVNVNGQKIAIRRDLVNATKVYDKIVDLRNQIDINDVWSDLDFDDIREAVNIVFDTGLVKAFTEDAIKYTIEEIIPNIQEFEATPYSSEIMEALQLLISEYKNDPTGFLNGFKNDIFIIVNIAEDIFQSGLFDKIMNRSHDYNSYISIIKENDYQLLKNITDIMFNSYAFKIAVAKGTNIGLDFASDQITEEVFVNFGQTTPYASINWNNVRNSIKNILTNTVDAFDIINDYGIENLKNPKNLLINILSDEAAYLETGVDLNNDIPRFMTILGKELNLIANSPLFAGQSVTPYTGLLEWLETQPNITKFLDVNILENINWEFELENLSDAVIYFKDSGALKHIVESIDANQETDFPEVINALLVIPDDSTKTYLSLILTPVIESSLSGKILIYGVNLINKQINEALPLTFTISIPTENSYPFEDWVANFNFYNIEEWENPEELWEIVSDVYNISVENGNLNMLSGNIGITNTNQNVIITLKRKLVELESSNNISSQKDSIITVLENVLPSFSEIIGGEGFDMISLDLTSFGTALNALKENAYDTLGDEKEASLFGFVYKSLVEYLINIPNFGDAISNMLIDYENPYEVNWKNLFNILDLAQKLMDGSEIGEDDIGTILEYIGNDDKTEQEIQDAIINLIGAEGNLADAIDDLDFDDGATISVVETLAETIKSLSDEELTEENVADAITGLISDLDSIEGGDNAVYVFLGIINSLVEEEGIKNFEPTSTSGIEIADAISGSSFAENIQELLTNLFLGSGE